MRELGRRTNVASEVCCLVFESARDVESDPAERRELDAPCVGQIRRDAEEILLVGDLVARHEPPALHLPKDRADGQEPRRLLQGPALHVLRPLEEPVGHSRERHVAHVDLLVEYQICQHAERPAEHGKLDLETLGSDGGLVRLTHPRCMAARTPIALSSDLDILRPSDPGISGASERRGWGSTSTGPYSRLNRRTISRASSRCATWSSPTGTSSPLTIAMSTACSTG